jgi:hypothetical protein
VPLVILAFWIGIYPKPLFRVLDVPVRQIVEQVNPNYFNSATAQRWGEKPSVAIVTPAAPPKSDSVNAEKPVKPAAAAVIAAASTPLAATTAENR